MPGGLIQLAVYGGQDYYLTSNPQISYFKSVYRRYTNFSMEMINILPSTEKKLENASEVDITFTINRHGDLVKDIYFVFTLPDIYSNSTKKFQWIKRIGEYIIKEVSFNIGSRKIDTQYGEWLHIWNELNLDESKLAGYNRMIGNTTDLYDPETANPSGTYTASSSSAPSIKGRKIYVPLHFWFNESFGSALPLIAMQYDAEPTINIKLRKITDLFTVIDSGDRIKPTDSYNIGTFLSQGATASVTSLDISASIEANYIFLDKEERRRFALVEHQYLIKQIVKVENTLTPATSDTTYTEKLKIQHPTSSLIWVIRRSDLEAVNQWSNYTNWCQENIDPIYDQGNPFSATDLVLATDFGSLKNKNIMLDAALKLNGINRFDSKDYGLFNLTNNYQHNIKIPKEGIYSYSFGLNNNGYQPSGSCNMSRYNKIELQMTLTKKTSVSYDDSSSYNYNWMLFSHNYNVFRIQGGLGDVEFST